MGEFQPLELPAGVVAMPTKRMRSSNWSEVNAVRWIEGEMQPIGGQETIVFYSSAGNPIAAPFASRIRKIHPWSDLQGRQNIAYLCETNVYVDQDGTLIDITPTGGMQPPPVPVGGYGTGLDGMGLYGQPPRPGAGSAVALAVQPPVYSLANYGALLLVMSSSDGRLLQWDPNAAAGTLLTAVPNAPPGRCFVVTPDRFVMIFGMLGTGGSSRRFGWCDQENISNWDFASQVSKAGFYDVEPASAILTAQAGRSGWVLFFTAKKAYVVRFLGLPYVYNYDELADGLTPWSPQSITSTSQTMMWMSTQGAWLFDGTSINAVPCPIRKWITDDIDALQARFQACAAHLGGFNEFWWFFPQAGQPYNTRAVFMNYREGWWSQARMPRSAGITSSYSMPAVFADGLQAYRHESGQYYNNCALPFADTFSLNLSSGGRLTTAKQMLIDLDGDETNLQYQLYYRMSRLSSETELVTPPILIRPDGYLDLRTTGRDIRLRCSVRGPSVPPFTLGQHLIDIAQRGDA